VCNIVKRYKLVKDVNAEVHMKVARTQKAANTTIRCQSQLDQAPHSYIRQYHPQHFVQHGLTQCGDSITNLQGW